MDGSPITAGQIRPSAGAGEQGIPGKQHILHQQADGTGGMTRCMGQGR
jgi:hypothetical protein